MTDAYLEWLEIPHHLRPPTYYQLLGIAPSELDRDAISTAAERRLERLRPHQDGPDAEQYRRLTEEITRARDTLLDPVERQRYNTLTPGAAEQWWTEAEPRLPQAPSSPPIPGEEWWKDANTATILDTPRPPPEPETSTPAESSAKAPTETAWWKDPNAAEPPTESPPPAAPQISTAALDVEVTPAPPSPPVKDWWKGGTLEPELPAAVTQVVVEPMPASSSTALIAPPVSTELAPHSAPVVVAPEPLRRPKGFPHAWVLGGTLFLCMTGVATIFLVKQGMFDPPAKQVAQKQPKESPDPPEEKKIETPPKPKPKKPDPEPEGSNGKPKPKPEIEKKEGEPEKKVIDPPMKEESFAAAAFLGHKEGSVYNIALARDGKFFLDVSDDLTVVMYSQTQNNHGVLHKLRSPGVAVALCNNDRTAVFCDGGQVVVYDLSARKAKATFDNPRGGIRCLAAAPDGSFVLTGNTDSTVRWWTVADSKLAHTFDLDEKAVVTAAAIAPDGINAVFALSDGRLCHWDLQKRREQKKWKAHTGRITSLAFSPDGLRVASTGDDTLAQIWQVTSGKLLTKLTGHSAAVLGASWCADGHRIVTGGIDKRLCLWDAGKGKQPDWSVDLKEKIFSVVVDSKGRFALAGLSDGSVQRLPLPRPAESAPAPTSTELSEP